MLTSLYLSVWIFGLVSGFCLLTAVVLTWKWKPKELRHQIRVLTESVQIAPVDEDTYRLEYLQESSVDTSRVHLPLPNPASVAKPTPKPETSAPEVEGMIASVVLDLEETPTGYLGEEFIDLDEEELPTGYLSLSETPCLISEGKSW